MTATHGTAFGLKYRRKRKKHPKLSLRYKRKGYDIKKGYKSKPKRIQIEKKGFKSIYLTPFSK
jgi:ribonuclease HII